MSENINAMNKVFGRYLIGEYKTDIGFIEALIDQCVPDEDIPRLVKLFESAIDTDTISFLEFKEKFVSASSEEDHEHFSMITGAAYSTFGLYSELKAKRDAESMVDVVKTVDTSETEPGQ